MKLTRTQRAAHMKAMEILSADRISLDDREYVIDNWHQGASHDNASSSAFFTPWDLAFHLALNVSGTRNLLDICSGIGALSVGFLDHEGQPEMDQHVLVEINPDYCDVARKLLPKAEIICGSIYDDGLMNELATRGFECVISNPPFGNISRPQDDIPKKRRYRGPVHYELMDIVSDIAKYGAFILPQTACPFEYSGRQTYRQVDNPKYESFSKASGIILELGASTDTTVLSAFKDTNITVEIVTADFVELQSKRRKGQMELYNYAA